MAEKRDMMLINETSARVDGLSREASAARRTIREDPDDFSHCPDINPEIRLKFLVAPFVSETVPATQDQEAEKKKKKPEIYHPDVEKKIESIKRNVLDKKVQEEQKQAYEKKRAEEEKENEKKKKEHKQAESKKQFTFDFGGQIMYLKPGREDNIDVKEFTELVVNAKKNLKVMNPVEGEVKIKIAEILEKELPEKTHQSRGQQADERQKKQPKVVGPFKPSPPILEIIQVAPGVTISTAKNQVKRGQPVKPDGKLRFDEFKEKHRGISPQKHEDSDDVKQKEKEKKEKKEKKYRRTIDNWKEELKKGLKDSINFDADLLINLIMTDDFGANNEKKVQRRAEREKEAHDYFEFKKKLDHLLKNPDEFLNRVAVYKQEQKDGELADQKVEINPKLINEFQKAISQFNQKIVANKEPTINDDLLAQLPQTEMEENKYKFTRPQHMANASLIDNQVRTCLMKPPRVRKPTSAYKSTVGLANEKQFAIKRVQSGNLLRRSDTQGSRIFSAALPKNPSQAEFTKATGENKSKFLLKGNKA